MRTRVTCDDAKHAGSEDYTGTMPEEEDHVDALEAGGTEAGPDSLDAVLERDSRNTGELEVQHLGQGKAGRV